VRLRRGGAGDLGRAVARPLREQGVREDGDDRRAQFVSEREERCARGLSEEAVHWAGAVVCAGLARPTRGEEGKGETRGRKWARRRESP
jgi:hypothetical protein